MSSLEERAEQRKNWSVRKFDSFDELRRQQVLDWQSRPPEERLAAAWELARDYWMTVKGKTEDELRLQRSVGHSRSGRR
ncbi:MAG: hypothetical protein P1U85_15340 [Verrucomicrobiales bacterium]|nr:hypothetical protein [Verrucomicrobiales bacterium]